MTRVRIPWTQTVTCAGCSNFGKDKLEQPTSQLALEIAPIDQTSCCGNHGICSHQILQDECPGPKRKQDEKIIGRKVSLGQEFPYIYCQLQCIWHLSVPFSFSFFLLFFGACVLLGVFNPAGLFFLYLIFSS